MLKGQEVNIPFVTTCCSNITLVEQGTPGGTWMASPQSGKGRTGQSHHLPRHLQISVRHKDTKDTACQGLSCWQACNLPRCLEQALELAQYAGVMSCVSFVSVL